MIIDSHVHFGDLLTFRLEAETVLAAMEKYGIDAALVSNCGASECDAKQRELPPQFQKPMYGCTEEAIAFARRQPGRIFAAAWIKPRTEQPDERFRRLLSENRDVVKALKIHPYYSALPADAPRVEPYLELAEELELPVVVHTANDANSECAHVIRAARRHPGVPFVMAHLGLGTDNRAAIQAVAETPNLYGDTTWVPMESALVLLEKTGSEKLLFGSDLPIDGLDTYHHNPRGERSVYQDYFHCLSALIPPEDYENIMWRSAARLFGLPL